ncbi:MAG TPA: hypothetical protein VIK32_02685 [Candidatus Limnocylindrales bacterium]
MNGRKAKQRRRLVRMANYGDQAAIAWCMANLSRAKGQRSGTRMLAVEARRAGRQST